MHLHDLTGKRFCLGFLCAVSCSGGLAVSADSPAWSITARSAPIPTRSSSLARISSRVPENVAGTSVSTLGCNFYECSPSITGSPSCFNQREIVAFSTLSPNGGSTNLAAVSAGLMVMRSRPKPRERYCRRLCRDSGTPIPYHLIGQNE